MVSLSRIFVFCDVVLFLSKVCFDGCAGNDRRDDLVDFSCCCHHLSGNYGSLLV